MLFLFYILTLVSKVENVESLRVEELDNAVLEVEYYGKINIVGNCTNLIPNKPLLKCELNRESTYLQVINTQSDPMLKIKSYSSPSSPSSFSSRSSFSSTKTTNKIQSSNITGTFIGAGCQRLVVNAFRSYQGRDKYLTFTPFGSIPPIDNNTLQVEFILQYVFY